MQLVVEYDKSVARSGGAFALDDDAAFLAWRRAKLEDIRPGASAEVVALRDPRALTTSERQQVLACIARENFCVYQSDVRGEDRTLPVKLGAQLGLHRLDANWLAHEDGVSSIEVSDQRDDRGGFIPYTDRAIRWHTDGYYHPKRRTIHGMVLHCVRPAASGGVNRVVDHELVYLALRDAARSHAASLMQPDVMTIPERSDEGGVARAAQTGPVFSVDPHSGHLHMRYTARTRSIVWKDDEATRSAVRCLEDLLEGGLPWVRQVRLEPGMGIVGHNVLHERSSFVDDPVRPRLLYRARFLDRCSAVDARG